MILFIKIGRFSAFLGAICPKKHDCLKKTLPNANGMKIIKKRLGGI